MRNRSAAKTFRLLLGASIVAAGLAILMASLYSRLSGTPLWPGLILIVTLSAGVMIMKAGVHPPRNMVLADRTD